MFSPEGENKILSAVPRRGPPNLLFLISYFLFAKQSPCNNRQHNIHDHPRLYQCKRGHKAGLGGVLVGHGGQTAGQAGQQKQRQHGQEVPPLQAVQRVVLSGCPQKAPGHGQQAAE